MGKPSTNFGFERAITATADYAGVYGADGAGRLHMAWLGCASCT
jgi:hypothetical protein